MIPERSKSWRSSGGGSPSGVANLTALLDPSVVVMGGGLAGAGELLLEPTRRAYAEVLYAGGQRPPVSIVGAALGELAGAVGAALMARADSRSGVIDPCE